MKKVIFILLGFIAMGSVSYAQDGRGQRMSLEEREKSMVEKLGLDEDQQEKMSEINARFKESFSDFREEMRDAEEDARRDSFSKMRELNEKRNTEIRTILNEEQVATFDEIQKQREERMKNRPMRKRGERGGNTRPGK